MLNLCAAAGRLGINQAKAAAARRERRIWAGAADGHDESDAFGVDEANMACIDGLSLFDDAIFFTEVRNTLPTLHFFGTAAVAGPLLGRTSPSNIHRFIIFLAQQR